jgi:hypothetical protein
MTVINATTTASTLLLLLLSRTFLLCATLWRPLWLSMSFPVLWLSGDDKSRSKRNVVQIAAECWVFVLFSVTLMLFSPATMNLSFRITSKFFTTSHVTLEGTAAVRVRKICQNAEDKNHWSRLYVHLLSSGAESLCSSLLSKSVKTEIYRTIILPVVLCGCETWSLTWREECRLRVSRIRWWGGYLGPRGIR